MKMTPEEYITTGGIECPNCEAARIDVSGQIDYTADIYSSAPAECEECGATWTDEYNLVSYADLSVPS